MSLPNGVGAFASHARRGPLWAVPAFLAVACVAVVMLFVAGQAWASPTVPTYETSFNGSGSAAEGMEPNRLAVNEETGDVYVIDKAHDAVDIFEANGKYKGQLLGSATKAGKFFFDSAEDDIAVDNTSSSHKGWVYVESEKAPSGNEEGAVFAFDSTGKFMWETAPIAKSDICGIAVDPSGKVWKDDFYVGAQEISLSAGSEGEPVGNVISFTSMCHMDFNSEGYFVMNSWASSVYMYDAKGGFKAEYSNGVNYDVAVERLGNEVFTVQETQLAAYEPAGPAIGTFGETDVKSPNGVAVDSARHKLYVSDGGNARVDVFNAPSQFYTMNVSVTGSGSGSVSSTPNGIGCTPQCSTSFEAGQSVELAATPTPGSKFTGWVGGGCSGTAPCVVTMNEVKNVSANFEPIRSYTFGVSEIGSGTGSVTCDGGPCEGEYVEGTTVLVEAVPGTHTRFTGWNVTGDPSTTCAGSALSCVITVNGPISVTASFEANAEKPIVTTGGVSGLTQTGALVAGTVNPNGSNVTVCEVEYGTSIMYGSKAPCAALPGAGTSTVSVSASLTGLSPATAYHYRLVAANAGGATYGADQTFTTAEPAVEKSEGTKETRSKHGALVLAQTVSAVTGGKAAIRLSCVGQAPCTGTVKITVRLKARKGKRTVTAGSARVSIGAGRTATIKVKLAGRVVHLLASRHALKALVIGPGVRHPVILRSSSSHKGKGGKKHKKK